MLQQRIGRRVRAPLVELVDIVLVERLACSSGRQHFPHGLSDLSDFRQSCRYRLESWDAPSFYREKAAQLGGRCEQIRRGPTFRVGQVQSRRENQPRERVDGSHWLMVKLEITISRVKGDDVGVVYEVVHSRIRDGAEADMLALRPAMIKAVRDRCPGMLDAQLVHLDDDTWLDIVTWDSREAAERASAQFPAIPEAGAMASLLEEIMSFWHGEGAEPAPNGMRPGQA